MSWSMVMSTFVGAMGGSVAGHLLVIPWLSRRAAMRGAKRLAILSRDLGAKKR